MKLDLYGTVKGLLVYINQRSEYASSLETYDRYLKGVPDRTLFSSAMEAEVRDYYLQLGIPLRDTKAHQLFYFLNQDFDPRYISRHVFRNFLLSKFNQGDTWINRMKGWRDKNKYDMLGMGRFVPTEGRVVRGRLLDGRYRPISTTDLCRHFESVTDEAVVKESDSFAGKGVQIVPISNLPKMIETSLETSLRTGSSLSIQRPFLQHESMARLNPSSVNTMRITTFRMPGSPNYIQVVGPFVRIGRKGSRVDNVSQGNFCVGILENGSLKPWGYDKKFNIYERHTDHGYDFHGIILEHFKASCELCIDMHYSFYEMDMIAWDVVVDERGDPTILEFNVEFLDSDYNQICGGPLFGDLTDQLLREMSLKRYQKRFL